MITKENLIIKENLRRENFEPDDFFVSETAKLHKINNETTNQSILTCLMSTADMMQELRDLLEKPIKINSAYRCLELNRKIGSSDNSQHVQGLACDFTSSFGSPDEIIRFLFEKQFKVDQCLSEGSWVHISRSLKKNRMMFGTFLVNPKTKKREFRSL